jgi:hypothetical protein
LILEGNHHFVVVYRRATREAQRAAPFWFGHVTHIVNDKAGLQTTQKRIAFKTLDELPIIMRRCIGLDAGDVLDRKGDETS